VLTANAVNGAPIVSQEHLSSDIPPEAYKHFDTIQMYRPNDARKLKKNFLCAGKISVDQNVGIIAVRRLFFWGGGGDHREIERERERNIVRVWVLMAMTNSPVTKSQLVDTLSHNTASLLLGRLHARVCNQRAARLYYAARGHVCKLCMYFKNYTI
jgi:hypothetical protein